MKNKKIGIVIVTYNRLSCLKECIEKVFSQKRKYDCVIIIDNKSTDGTAEYLDSVNGIIVRHMAKNLGGAGGFYTGVKEAKKQECDWCTLIDDDAMLNDNFLYNLEKWQISHNDILALNPQVITENNISEDYSRRYHFDKKLNKYYEWFVPIDEYNKESFECDLVTFCGLTFNLGLVEKIGYPKKEMFIFYDDTEYSLRLRKYTKIYTVCSAVINHKKMLKIEVKKEKDNILSYATFWRRYYAVRNKIYMLKKHFGYMIAWNYACFIFRPFLQRIVYNQRVKMERYVIISAIVDGLLGRLGHRFGP